MVGLDQLQSLVHQGGAVDRDLPAHVPGRVRERLLAGHAAELGSVRPRKGPPLAVSTRRSTVPGRSGGDQLVERRVLGVHRDDARARGLGQGLRLASTRDSPCSQATPLSAREWAQPGRATRALSTMSQSPPVITPRGPPPPPAPPPPSPPPKPPPPPSPPGPPPPQPPPPTTAPSPAQPPPNLPPRHVRAWVPIEPHESFSPQRKPRPAPRIFYDTRIPLPPPPPYPALPRFSPRPRST